MIENHTAKWLDGIEPDAAAALRIFAIPYAGASSHIYRGWQEDMAPGVQLCPVHLPGRAKRMRERPYSRMNELVDAAAQSLVGHLGQPFALFGHSMGGLVAFALAYRLQTQFGVVPAAVIVAGCSPPHVERSGIKLHEWSDEDLLAELQRRGGTPADVLSCAQMMKVLFPVLRADFELAYTYKAAPAAVLDCPIYAFAGSEDREDGPSSMCRWQEVTTGPFELSVIPGSHLFPFSARMRFMPEFLRLLVHLTDRARQGRLVYN
jgi:medium-chain acyl-[acyl-carrier-protein] hydrolase